MRRFLGVAPGSTRIKAVAIDAAYRPVSSGDYTWKSDVVDGIWTCDLAEVWAGLKAALSQLEDWQRIACITILAPNAQDVADFQTDLARFVAG